MQYWIAYVNSVCYFSDRMLEKPPISEQKIADHLKARYGLNVIHLTFLPLGADMNAAVYKADTDTNKSYFVKLRRNAMQDFSVNIINLLHDSAINEVIPPIKTIDGQSSQMVDDYMLVVFPYVDGKNGFDTQLNEDQWLRLGGALRRLHDISIPSSLQSRLRQETYSDKWREIVKSFYVVVDADSRDDEAATKLRAFVLEKLPLIQQLVTHAEELAVIAQSQNAKFVLCHADIHAGNVLISQGDEIYIVDWDDPMLAPKERDLMFIGGGVANVWNVPHEQTLFYKGYGKTKINYSLLAYYRCERIVEDMAIYLRQILLTSDGGTDRLQTYKHFVEMFSPNGVVSIAFQTGLLCRKNRSSQ